MVVDVLLLYKMIKRRNECFLTLVISFSTLRVSCLESASDIYIHCMQTARNRLDSTPRTIIPVSTIVPVGQPQTSGTNTMNLDLCPDHRFLKISWISNQTQADDQTLCYKMNSNNETILDTVCYNLHLIGSQYPSAMDCWFPMKFIDRGPIITAWLHPLTPTLEGSFSGSLDTSLLDPVNTCKDMCEVVEMHIGSQINCQDTASIIYDTSTVVKHLSFDTIDQSACEQNLLHITRRTESGLEYQLTCGFNGFGHVKVLYTTHGKYCLKYQLVTVRCPNESSTTIPLMKEADGVHSFGTFVLFGFVCIIVIGAAFFGIIFVVQRVMIWRKRYFKSHRDSVTDSRNDSISAEASVPLNVDGMHQLTESVPQCSSENTNKTILPRKPSRRRFSSTSLSMVPEMMDEKRGIKASTMRKSVTMALLEDTDPFYKKKILFLPVPFDHFTNEVTKLLKTIFSTEAGLLSQCCYDRNVHKHYMISDHVKWIDNLLGDHDKILVFLCFKVLCTERVDGKATTMVEDILDRLLLSKMESPRLCKVLFLYLTDSSENVQRKHYGDVFHICNSNSYTKFVSNVMSFCGRELDENPDMLDRLLNCQSSKQFLRYTGIKETMRNDVVPKNKNIHSAK